MFLKKSRQKRKNRRMVEELIESTKPPVPKQYGLRLFNMVYCVIWACLVWYGIIKATAWLVKGFNP